MPDNTIRDTTSKGYHGYRVVICEEHERCTIVWDMIRDTQWHTPTDIHVRYAQLIGDEHQNYLEANTQLAGSLPADVVPLSTHTEGIELLAAELALAVSERDAYRGALVDLQKEITSCYYTAPEALHERYAEMRNIIEEALAEGTGGEG
jgi:hypothetical protein